MTDRTDHSAAAERLLADACEWGWQAEEPTPEVGELTCLAYAAVHALLAIHDTLTAVDRYATNEARQREAGADPLDEDDHRDRVDRNGDRWKRNMGGCWHAVVFDHGGCEVTLAYLADRYGPLTFAPEPPPDATGGDLSAPEGESGSEERGDAEEAPGPLLCVECGEGIFDHSSWGDDARSQYRCPLTVNEAVRALIEQAVEQAGDGRG